MKPEKSKARNGWRTVKLGEVCELNPRRPKLERATTTPTTFVQMSAVAENGGGIVRPETRPFGQVAKGYTFFAEGDVIFAKITPCMQNGKHAIAGNLLDGIGFGSTEFHVFRPGGEIISEWILNFLLQPKISAEAERHFTGAVGQQRVPENILADMEIALPPVQEQRRIAAQLREQMAEVNRARAAVQAQLETAQALPAALLRDVFDSRAAKKWPLRRLGDSLVLRKEIVHPSDNPKGPAIFVGLEHVESQMGKRIGGVNVEMAELTGRKPRFRTGDIVYGYLRPYLNKVWVADFDGLCSVDQYAYSVRSDIADTGFIAWFMRSPCYLERAPIGDTPGQLPRIRLEEVASVQIGLPPLAEQRAVAKRIETEIGAFIQLRDSLQTRLAEIELLPAALLRSAFSQQN
jgi:type I restriction enzyme S subunit